MRRRAIINAVKKDEIIAALLSKNQIVRNHCEDLGEVKIILKLI